MLVLSARKASAVGERGGEGDRLVLWRLVPGDHPQDRHVELFPQLFWILDRVIQRFAREHDSAASSIPATAASTVFWVVFGFTGIGFGRAPVPRRRRLCLSVLPTAAPARSSSPASNRSFDTGSAGTAAAIIETYRRGHRGGAGAGVPFPGRSSRRWGCGRIHLLLDTAIWAVVVATCCSMSATCFARPSRLAAKRWACRS